MSRIQFAVMFYVRKAKSTENQGLSLYARITQHGKRVDFTMNKTVNPNDWNPEGGCVLLKSKDSKELNSFIEKARQKINNIKLSLEERNKPLQANSFFEVL